MTALLISTPVNIYYLTGRVFAGYVYLPEEGEPIYFIQRSTDIQGEQVVSIRKPEDIPALLQAREIPIPERLGLELDALSYNEIVRLKKAFGVEEVDNASLLMRQRRMIKRPDEIEQIRISAQKHMEVYDEVPALYKAGMRDIDLQIEIEHLMRQKGSIGLFRAFGSNMDIFMGSLLVGESAATPSPFDFALGGAGTDPSLPIGASGELITPGKTVTVDMAGNYTAYLSDMTRVFTLGGLPDIAIKAHLLSLEMHQYFKDEVKPGVACAEIYNKMVEMAKEAGLADCFMGTKQQAKFVGHGVGLEINEPPVLTARSKDVIQENMVIALEPKFVIEGVGAVGIESTYLITAEGNENLTPYPEGILQLKVENGKLKVENEALLS